MKAKKFVVILCMMVCAYEMFAQTEYSYLDTIPKSETVEQNSSTQELIFLLREFNAHALAEQQLQIPDYDKIYVPVCGDSKFAQRHHIMQRLEISMLGGADKDDDNPDADDVADAAKGKEESDPVNPMNIGFNIGYSAVFVPGKTEKGKLHLNRFGFAYSLGFLAALDRQEKFGITFDFLGKVGLETGNSHAMGLGVDFLFGGGKSAVLTALPFTADFTYKDHDTEWCLKYGFQIWLRSNLLHANIQNTDVRLFVRYVYSQNPTNEMDLDFDRDGVPSGYYIWNPESWQFGLTYCYEF